MTTASPKSQTKKIQDYKKRAERKLTELLESNEKLVNIPLTNHKKKLTICGAWTEEYFGMAKSTVIRHLDIASPILNKLNEMGLIDLEASNKSNLHRSRALRWYRSLSFVEKKALPIENGTIYFRRLITGFEGKSSFYTDPYFECVIDEISDDLIKLGIINEPMHGKIPRPQSFSTEDYLNEWSELSNIEVNSINELVNPTKDLPIRQLSQLYASVVSTLNSVSAKNDFKNSFKHVLDFYLQEYGDNQMYLDTWLDEFILNRFHKYLESLVIVGKLSSKFANNIQNNFTRVLNRAKDLKLPNFTRFYQSSNFDYETRVTHTHLPFSDKERVDIAYAINLEIKHTNSLLLPYVRANKGTPIYDENGKKLIRLKPGEKHTLDEARWIFENYCNCEPVTYKTAIYDNNFSSRLYRIILSHDLDLFDVYESWGILARVTAKHILPYYLRFLQITGMNIEAINLLEIDDYVESHPASGKPCIRYWKERSDGEKEYHLDIFKADLQWLTGKQSQEVKQVFDDVIKLTAKVRAVAPKEMKNNLWLFLKYNKTVETLPSCILSTAIANFVDKHKLIDVNGDKTKLIFTRFRPTFVSDLVDAGVALREIQLLMGHANLTTTIRYLDRQDFSKKMRGKIRDKLTQIHINANSATVGISTEEDKGKDNEIEVVMISTPMATCKNIFNPPDSVKALANYVPGTPCSIYNMCLGCSNVIITQSDLPKLFAMQRDYVEKIQNSRVLDTPMGVVVRENLELLKPILNAGDSDFTDEELEEAKTLSLYVETTEMINGL